MKFLSKLLTGIIILFIYNTCDDPTNPFDPDTPKEIWTPSDFKATQSGDQVNLTWIQKETNIDGFEIERKVGNSEWSDAAKLGKTTTSWTDNDLTGGETYQYQLHAYAGENESNIVSASITPIIKALVSILQANNLQPTSVTLNGSINANGSLTTVTFLYKKKSSSDWISVDANIKTVEGKTVVSVYANISNLSPGEEYIFKVKAVNSSGEVLSAEQSFKTPDFDVSPSTREVSWQAGTTTFVVNSNVDWDATDDASWLTATKASSNEISVSYFANTTNSFRTANIRAFGTGGVEATVTVTQSSNVLAYYPLISSAKDNTENYSDITVKNCTWDAIGIYSNGIYSNSDNGCLIQTPIITGLNKNSFEVSVDFYSDLPTEERPVFTIGISHSEFGFLLNGDKTVSLLLGNSQRIITTKQFSLNTWQNGKIVYENEMAKLYLNNTLIISKSFSVTFPDSDRIISNNNFGNGKAFKGYWRNLVIKNR